jgi:hypothetical protein
MIALGRSFAKVEGWLTTTTGLRFRGIIMPAPEVVSAGEIVEHRLLLKTRPNEPVAAGMLITDPTGRPFLLGRDDTQLSEDTAISKTYRLFRMTGQYSWTRVVSTTDIVTNLPKRVNEQSLGPIYCAIEQYKRLDIDKGTYMAAETKTVITGSPVQFQDKIDTFIVRRITPVFGIYICETE